MGSQGAKCQKRCSHCSILQGSAAHFRFHHFWALKWAENPKIGFLALEAEGDFLDQI